MPSNDEKAIIRPASQFNIPKNPNVTKADAEVNITKKSPMADAFLRSNPIKLTKMGVINIAPPTPNIPENNPIKLPMAT